MHACSERARMRAKEFLWPAARSFLDLAERDSLDARKFAIFIGRLPLVLPPFIVPSISNWITHRRLPYKAQINLLE